MAENIFSVTNIQEELVSPASETPNHALNLSELDHWFPIYVSIFCVYDAEDNHESREKNPASVIKDALAKILVSYYPVAGRLRKTDDGRFEVHCKGQGVLLTEAKANCSLADVCHLKDAYDPVADSPLFHHFEPWLSVMENPLVAIQVTMFDCGGFVIGIKGSHAIMDGQGYAMFMKALEEVARKGGDGHSPSFPLVWQRERLTPRQPPQFDESLYQDAIPLDILGDLLESDIAQRAFVRTTFVFTADFIRQVKEAVVAESEGTLSYCSTFEAVVGLIWKTYIKAMDFQESAVGFTFVVNARKAMKNVISGDRYYGNCILCASVKPEDVAATSPNREKWQLVKKSDVVKCVRKAKAGVDEEYVRSTIDYLHAEKGRKMLLPGASMPEGVKFNDWSQYDCVPDLGLGKGLYATVADKHPCPYVAVLPKLCDDTSVSVSLPEEVMPIFKALVGEPARVLLGWDCKL